MNELDYDNDYSDIGYEPIDYYESAADYGNIFGEGFADNGGFYA